MADDPGVVLHNVAVAVDYSGCELTGHSFVPPNEMEIILWPFVNFIIQIRPLLQERSSNAVFELSIRQIDRVCLSRFCLTRRRGSSNVRTLHGTKSAARPAK